MKFIEVTIAVSTHKIYVNPCQIAWIDKNEYGYTVLHLTIERCGNREVTVNENLEDVLSMCGGCETIERVYKRKAFQELLNEQQKGEL